MVMKFKKIAIIGKYPSLEETKDIHDQLIQLINHLSKKNIDLVIEEKTQNQIKLNKFKSLPLSEIAKQVDIAIVVGGDGTMLGVARILVDTGIPLIGINQGRFGFLADLNINSMFSSIDNILDGFYIQDNRMLIETTIIRNNKPIHESFALNDIVIRSGLRLIELEVIIDNNFVHTQRSDGLIVSTPTGTTAYALSAGGPIIHPNLDAITFVPISPHTLSNRPIAVSGDSEILIKIVDMDEANASIDGQIQIPLDKKDTISIKKAKQYISILHPQDYCYFEMLRNKLNWG
ncbi:NAD(+) kinase [Methylophilaceae bacterium]|mgnify:FL=1|jgi:NAD+ kinase|nr:NAD(+) kinase [Methylophilaceae bacterium]